MRENRECIICRGLFYSEQDFDDKCPMCLEEEYINAVLREEQQQATEELVTKTYDPLSVEETEKMADFYNKGETMGNEPIRVYIKADDKTAACAVVEVLLGIELNHPGEPEPRGDRSFIEPSSVYQCDIDYTPEAMELVLREHAKDRIFAIERPKK